MARKGRSLPPGAEPWKTFAVSVRQVRGDARVYAAVRLSHVTGVAGAPFAPRVVWEGFVARREAGRELSPEEAAELAATALREAYPGLF